MDHLTNLPPELLYSIGELVLLKTKGEICKQCNICRRYCTLGSLRLTCKAFATIGAQIVTSPPFVAENVNALEYLYGTHEIVEAVLDNPIFSSTMSEVCIRERITSESPSTGVNTKRIFEKARKSCPDLMELGVWVETHRVKFNMGYGFTFKVQVRNPDLIHSDMEYTFEGPQSTILRDVSFSPLREEEILDSAWSLDISIDNGHFEDDQSEFYTFEQEKANKELAQLLARASKTTRLNIRALLDTSPALINTMLVHMEFADLREFNLRLEPDSTLSQNLMSFIDRHTTTLVSVELSFRKVRKEPSRLRMLARSFRHCHKVVFQEIEVESTCHPEGMTLAEKNLNDSEWSDVIEKIGGEKCRGASPSGSFIWRRGKKRLW